jgi:hypothetical protein
MATKAHDAFTIPLCRKHHTELHNSPAAFERQYGTQPELIIKLLVVPALRSAFWLKGEPMRDMYQVMDLWGAWAALDNSGVDWQPIAAGFRGFCLMEKITTSM